jgi:hypothetical protein
MNSSKQSGSEELYSVSASAWASIQRMGTRVESEMDITNVFLHLPTAIDRQGDHV